MCRYFLYNENPANHIDFWFRHDDDEYSTNIQSTWCTGVFGFKDLYIDDTLK